MDSPDKNTKLLEDLNDQKIWEYAPAIAYSASVMILGIFGNIFSIVYYGFKSPKTTTNNLITALAITDSVTCIVFCDEIIELCFTITFKNVIGCKLMYFTNHSLVVGSSFILALICVDRFRKICRRQSWQLTVTTARICIGVLSFLAFLLSIRDFVILDVVQVNLTLPMLNRSITGYYCTHTRERDRKTIVTAFQLLDLSTFIIVLSTVTVLYSFVARELWIQRKRKESHMLSVQVKSSVPESESADVKCFPNVLIDKTISSAQDKIADSNYSHSDTNADIKIPQLVSSTLSERKEIYNIAIFETYNKSCEATNRTENIKEHKERNSKRKHAYAIERKIAVMMIVITAASFLSFVPYFIVSLGLKRKSNTPEQEFSVGVQIALRSFMLNNAVNPYIMGLFNTQFRCFVKDSLSKCQCLRK
ncbi:growth hormone secretagogue receptor type 1-like [Mercenaria mercenaria]|uniref:growth hormone secretagogue receptor type 1-like n=1 Tax=Mercenaria mercenaria TaxID=6596 RepID=UPI00234F459E|nr:growth hormone secretagogue receptor type 1-like [Mercenaria mercenaria]